MIFQFLNSQQNIKPLSLIMEEALWEGSKAYSAVLYLDRENPALVVLETKSSRGGKFIAHRCKDDKQWKNGEEDDCNSRLKKLKNTLVY